MIAVAEDLIWQSAADYPQAAGRDDTLALAPPQPELANQFLLEPAAFFCPGHRALRVG
jgi:hypothetical protein